MRYRVVLQQKGRTEPRTEVFVSASSEMAAARRALRKASANLNSSTASLLHEIELEVVSVSKAEISSRKLLTANQKKALFVGVAGIVLALVVLNYFGQKWTGWVILVMLCLIGYGLVLSASSSDRLWIFSGPYLSKIWYFIMLGLIAGIYYLLKLIGAIVY